MVRLVLATLHQVVSIAYSSESQHSVMKQKGGKVMNSGRLN